jgi:hypothetical protein
MMRARACVVLLALLPACIEFPDGKSYACSADTAATDCPSGWICDGEQCIEPGGSGSVGSACAAACDRFFGCGYATACQANETCSFIFLYAVDASSCTDSCRENQEDNSVHALLCYSTSTCSDEGFSQCLGT